MEFADTESTLPVRIQVLSSVRICMSSACVCSLLRFRVPAKPFRLYADVRFGAVFLAYLRNRSFAVAGSVFCRPPKQGVQV